MTISDLVGFRQSPHCAYEILEHWDCCFFGQGLVLEVSSAEVLAELSLVEDLKEQLDSFTVACELEYLEGVDLFLFIIAVEIYFSEVVLEKLLFVAVLREVDVLELDQSKLAEPC